MTGPGTPDPVAAGFVPERLARLDAHFARYVEDGRLPGWLALVSRGGTVAHLSRHGMRDAEAGLPVQEDTLFRMYSMTKPITSVAAMMLYEEGAFELTDPVAEFIPSFADMRVFRGGTAAKPVTVPAAEPVRIWHLLSHTAGLTYGNFFVHPVDEMYRKAGFVRGNDHGLDLAGACDAWAAQPLLFEPGSEWNYSVATDVLGRVVEVASGRSLDAFFAERIFGPLKMTDTTFHVTGDALDRLAALYVPNPDTGTIQRADDLGGIITRRPRMLSGGGGLASTAGDYLRFTRMLLGGGELDGVRLLGRRTVDYMTRNHLPGGASLADLGREGFSEVQNPGMGFGLGFSVVLDPAACRTLCSPGEYAWGGVASTAFWIDPSEDLIVIFLTQLLPSSTHPIRPQLKQLVYQALA